MTEETLKYVKEIAIRNYTNVALLLVAVSSTMLAFDNPMQLVLLKLCVVPLFYLSFKGLRSIYRNPVIEHKFTVRSVEFTFLQALIVSLFVCVLFWTPENTTNELLGILFLSVCVTGLCNFARVALQIKSINRQTGI